jgi:hypothetical protein
MTPFQQFVNYTKKNSLSRSNRFAVDIHGPGNANAIFPDINADDLCILCSQATFPGIDLGVADANHPGPAVSRASGVIDYNGRVSMTFYLDQAGFVRRYFEEWIALTVDPISYLVGYSTDYLGDLKINQLDMADQITSTSVIIDGYPTSIRPVDVSAFSNNQFSSIVVDFSYYKHYSISASGTYDINRAQKFYDTSTINTFNTN